MLLQQKYDGINKFLNELDHKAESDYSLWKSIEAKETANHGTI